MALLLLNFSTLTTEHAARVLAKVPLNRNTATVLPTRQQVELLFAVLHAHTARSAAVAEQACTALANVSAVAPGSVVAADSMALVLTAMRTHQGVSGVQEAGIAAVAVWAADPALAAALRLTPAVATMTDASKKFSSHKAIPGRAAVVVALLA